MVCLDMNHPDIEAFVNWKVREEIKVAALVEGMKAISGEKASPLDDPRRWAIRPAASGSISATTSTARPTDRQRAEQQQLRAHPGWLLRRGRCGRGVGDGVAHGRGEGEANAARVRRPEAVGRSSYAAWRCADPGVQFDTTINAWHTCPSAGWINASNPCSEYMFLDNTACNLASLNVIRFYDCEKALRRRGVRARDGSVDGRAGDQRADGGVPEPGGRGAELEVSHAGAGLRQSGRDADAGGHPLRQRRRARDLPGASRRC